MTEVGTASMTRKRLDGVDLMVTWSTLIGSLAGALRGTGDPVEIRRLMGDTGFAFRLALTESGGVLARAPAAASLDLRGALPLLANAGREIGAVVAARGTRAYDMERQKALKQVRRSIDRGRPAIAFDLHLPEFGLVRGYDDRARTLLVSSLMSGQYGEVVQEDRWPVPERDEPLIVLLLGNRRRVDRARAARDALRFALDYTAQGDPGDPTGATHGLAAFSRWRAALESGAAIDRAGHARVIQNVQAARHDAAGYLRDLAAEHAAAAASFTEAAAAYDRVALSVSRLATLFPYPAGGDLDNAGLRRLAAATLGEAETHERVALKYLAAALPAI